MFLLSVNDVVVVDIIVYIMVLYKLLTIITI